MKGKAPVAIAILLAIAASFIGKHIISQEQMKIRSKWKTVQILVASQTIRPGTPLTEEVVASGEIPEQYYTNTMLTPSELEMNRRRIIIHRIAAGQPIYFHNLESQIKQKSLGEKLRAGARAITIPVNQTSAVGYWIRPNDHVDILGTFQNRAGDKAEMVAITLLENIVVLKTGNKGSGINNPNSSDYSYSTITLLVLPEEAEMLLLAQKIGTLSLTLRNPTDRELMQERSWTTLKTLLTRERAKKLRTRRIHTLDTVRILRGIKGTPLQ